MAETMLQAGWARAEITPPLGSRLRGYDVERLADGVHDPLNAKSLWLVDGTEQLAFVALDLVAVDGRVTKAVRERVAQAHGLAPERLVLPGTKTRLGPWSHEHMAPRSFDSPSPRSGRRGWGMRGGPRLSGSLTDLGV